MKRMKKSIALGVSVAFCLLAMFAPPMVQDSKAVPACFVEVMYNGNGNECNVCVVGSADIMLHCECGDRICYID